MMKENKDSAIEIVKKIISEEKKKKESITNIKTTPVNDTVLVLLKKIEEKTKGGIIVTESYKEREQMLEDSGILVDVGEFAFFDAIANGLNYPRIGDKVYFKRHSGILHNGEDGKEYRFIQDSDIYATRLEMEINNG